MIIREAIKEFLLDHQGRGSKPKTIFWYKSTLSRLLKPYLESPATDLTVFVVNKVLNMPHLRPASLANYDRALRGFCNWLHGVELIEKNPFEKRKRPKESFQLKEVLSLEEIGKLFEVAKLDKRFRYRNQAILAIFLDAGLRASEVARLQLTDVGWEDGTLKVNGKTGYSAVPIGRKTLKLLRTYVTKERKGQSGTLFLYDGKPLNQESLSHLVSRTAKRAGIVRPVGCHLLRHSYATHYLKSGGDPFSLQRTLRHSSPAMTQRYLHFVIADLVEKNERFSPMSRLL